MDLDVGGLEDLEHLVGGELVALRRRDDERERALVVVHPVAVHLVEVVEPLVAVLGDVRDTGQGGGDAVVHLLAERPRVLRVRHREVPARLLRAERLALLRIDVRIGEIRTRVGDLGQDARLAVVDHVLPRRRPHVVALDPGDALLALGNQRRRHRLADGGLAQRQDRMDVDVERIGERRHEDPRSVRALLVHVVRDDRPVLVLHQLDVHARFLLRQHEPVAVVVVADVLVVQVRIDARVGRALGLVPVVDDQMLPVGIDRRDEQDHRVLEHLARCRRRVGGQAVDDVDDRLTVRDLGRVDGGVEQIEGLAFGRQLLRLAVGQPARIGEPAVDGDQPVEAGQVLRRADPQQRVVVAQRRLAEHLELDAVGLFGQQREVLEDLRIRRQLAVSADLEAEELLRRRHRLRASEGWRQQEDHQRQDGQVTCHRLLAKANSIAATALLD